MANVEPAIGKMIGAFHKLNREQQAAYTEIVQELRRLQKRVASDDTELERLYREAERTPYSWS